MYKGDSVVANHPDSMSNKLIRSYGIFQKITKAGVMHCLFSSHAHFKFIKLF